MGRGLHQTLWDLLRRLSHPGPYFEAKRLLVQGSGRCVQSKARRRESVNSHSLATGLAIFLLSHGTCSSQQATTQPPRPWMNPSLSPDRRADMVVEQLTLDEKI